MVPFLRYTYHDRGAQYMKTVEEKQRAHSCGESPSPLTAAQCEATAPPHSRTSCHLERAAHGGPAGKELTREKQAPPSERRLASVAATDQGQPVYHKAVQTLSGPPCSTTVIPEKMTAI